jgi:hypothetical protein
MSSIRVLEALNILNKYPELQDYIKTFDSPCGFMYNVENDPVRKRLAKQLDDLLDPCKMHSGASWSYMLRNVQAVLNGVITREYIINQIEKENCKREELDWKKGYAHSSRRKEIMRVAELSGVFGKKD